MRSIAPTHPRGAVLAAVGSLLVGLAAPGCGSEDTPSDEDGTRPAPEASAFPAPPETLEDLIAEVGASELVVSPSGQSYLVGRNRLGFGVFEPDRTQITEADVALYAAHGPDGAVEGPFPARVESLETEPAFTARTTADDPDAAQVVYVTELVLDRPGEWRLVAVVRNVEGGGAVRLPSVVAVNRDPVPEPGTKVPRVHTPTADEVGNIAEIDTRVPPSTMHEDDLADVLGKEPVVLLFATPALCASRVCGPVVDVAEQVKRERGDEAAFIHMEIYEDNDPNAGVRPQVRAFGLPSEPWLFVIDRKGMVDTRIEGAFSLAELNAALDRVTG